MTLARITAPRLVPPIAHCISRVKPDPNTVTTVPPSTSPMLGVIRATCTAALYSNGTANRLVLPVLDRARDTFTRPTTPPTGDMHTVPRPPSCMPSTRREPKTHHRAPSLCLAARAILTVTAVPPSIGPALGSTPSVGSPSEYKNRTPDDDLSTPLLLTSTLALPSLSAGSVHSAALELLHTPTVRATSPIELFTAHHTPVCWK